MSPVLFNKAAAIFFHKLECASKVVFLQMSAAGAESTTKREADAEKARRGLTRGTFFQLKLFVASHVINWTPSNTFFFITIVVVFLFFFCIIQCFLSPVSCPAESYRGVVSLSSSL